MFNHTDETDALIKAAYTDGTSLALLAESLGVTKNTIIGRAKVLKLCREGAQLIARKTPQSRKNSSEAAKRRWAKASSEERKMVGVRLHTARTAWLEEYREFRRLSANRS